MSFRSHSLQRPTRSLSGSSSASHSSDVDPEPPRVPTAPPRQADNMDQRPDRRVYSQSTPSLVHQFDGQLEVANNNAESDGDTPRAALLSRNHNHGAVATHLLSTGGQAWMDFRGENGAVFGSHPRLYHAAPPTDGPRDDGPSRFTLPNHPARITEQASRTARVTDRKRRLTTPEAPMRRPTSTRVRPEVTAVASSGTTSDPIVLDSSPAPARPPPPPSFPAQASMARPLRRESEGSIVLPTWQPDSDVSHCPVCKSQFTFFYRKHHCRKCGRVVCSACSPHRITIPRQFIVHPPTDPTVGANIIDLTSDDDTNAMSAFGPFRNPALGGGEEVRVCNPCVPDPNYSPPPQYTPNPMQRYSAQNLSPIRPGYPPRNASLHGLGVGPPRGHRSSHSVQDGSQTIGHVQTQRSHDAFGERALSFHNSTSVADLWPPTQPPQSNHTHPLQSSQYTHHSINPHQRMNSTSASSGLDSGHMHRPSLVQRFMPPPQPPPRRQIAEEDECPICGNELPPKGPDGEEEDRIEHVQECLAMHSSSPPQPSTNQTSTSLPSQRTRGMSNAASLLGNGEGASNMNRMSHSARGMVSYKASEKDCTDDDGEPAECVICFEEFETGDDMGRLVCWCKFHEHCIRQWWEKKGRGACPTHQLHE